MRMFFDRQIALLKQKPASQEAAFQLLADELVKEQCVNADFLENIIKRELVFPPGWKLTESALPFPTLIVSM
jgi:PTS system galactitol-specific IIA component